MSLLLIPFISCCIPIPYSFYIHISYPVISIFLIPFTSCFILTSIFFYILSSLLQFPLNPVQIQFKKLRVSLFPIILYPYQVFLSFLDICTLSNSHFFHILLYPCSLFFYIRTLFNKSESTH